MTDCIFCQILAGEAPGSFVYRDEHTAAIMDINQPNPYRVLVMPIAHVEAIYDLNRDQAAQIFQTTVLVANAVRAASGCDGMNLFQNNGRVAMQTVFHFHMHVLPRFAGDRLLLRLPLARFFRKDRAELDRMAAAIRAHLQPDSTV
ncbi:MAG: HIT family protein [Chloroflexi bacterium]|nr:HIT family protein [Chloroflexota bacterium]